MQLFVLSNHCTSNTHCGTCRKLDDGRPWRNKLTKLFLLPDNNIDFACPYGKEWIGRKPTQPMRAPTNAVKLSPPTSPPSCSPCQRKRMEAQAKKNNA